MKFQCTDTFEETNNTLDDLLTEEEYAERCIKYKKDGIDAPPSRYRFRQLVSVGGSRSSKSYSILQKLMLKLVSTNNIKITVWRNMKNVCRQTVLEDFEKIIQFNSYIYSNFVHNKQSGTFTFIPTQSKIVFEGADNIGKVLGSAQDISFFNEVTEFNHEVYLQITQRTADQVICDYNPSKDFWLESYRFDDETQFIHSTFLDNFYCPVNIVRQLLSYEPWERGSYDVVGGEIHFNGKPLSNTNQPPRHEVNWKKKSANEFMWMVYGLGLQAEKPERIYKGWQKITQSYFDKLEYISYFGLDFGSSNPTACVEVKYDGDGAFYISPRFYKPINNLDDSLPTTLKHNVPQIRKGDDLLICDSAKETYITSLQNADYMALGATKGGGSIEFGIMLVQGFTVYYVDDLEFIKEYNTYSWMLDRYGKATDTPLKKDDHYMDALRYIITYLVTYLDIKL